MTTSAGVSRTTTEVLAHGPSRLVHPGWAHDFRWVDQGTTTRGRGANPFDLGLFSGGLDEEMVRAHWVELCNSLGYARAQHARQVHGDVVRSSHPQPVRDEGMPVRGEGMEDLPLLTEPCDGHVTREAGVLLAVTTADCVPVFFVDPSTRAVGAIHAGWRGVAAGVFERGLDELVQYGSGGSGEVHVHMGPAICGSCYEVGPEVYERLGLTTPGRPTPIDLRRVLVDRAIEHGVPAEQISVSSHCTRCTESELFSHRAGDPYRQVGFIGIREGGPLA